ncbi:MAG: hypothetical protein ACJAZ9_000390 [Neolewinella sp.]|jgi:hypothetical protein
MKNILALFLFALSFSYASGQAAQYGFDGNTSGLLNNHDAAYIVDGVSALSVSTFSRSNNVFYQEWTANGVDDFEVNNSNFMLSTDDLPAGTYWLMISVKGNTKGRRTNNLRLLTALFCPHQT